jgi:hypothetical protein
VQSWGPGTKLLFGPPPIFFYIILLDSFKKTVSKLKQLSVILNSYFDSLQENTKITIKKTKVWRLQTGPPDFGAPGQHTRLTPHLHGPGLVISTVELKTISGQLAAVVQFRFQFCASRYKTYRYPKQRRIEQYSVLKLLILMFWVATPCGRLGRYQPALKTIKICSSETLVST